MGNPWNNRENQAPSKQQRTYSPEAFQDIFDGKTDENDNDAEQSSDADGESDDAEEQAHGQTGWDSKRLNIFSNPKLCRNNPKWAKVLVRYIMSCHY